MALTLEEFLDLPSVQDARPLVLQAPADPQAPVRWVHSSEIYEIGPLLSGGDLLLTTGLGLAGADAGARRHWVRELAARGVAAVGLELGRSLTQVPPEVEDEARRSGLPLLVLQEVVPFIRICEEANTAILDAEGRRLRHVDGLLAEVHAALAAGGGTSALVECAARVLSVPVALVTGADQVVAAAGVDGQRRTERLLRHPVARAPVRVWDVEWGAVLLGGPAAGTRTLDMAATRLAAAAAVVLGRSGSGGPSDVVAPFLADLLAGAVPGLRELVVRAGLAGFQPPRDALVAGLAASSPDPDAVAGGWRTAASRAGVELVAHPVRGEVLGLVALPGAAGRAEAERRTGDIVGRRGAVVAVGPFGALTAVAHSLRDAHSALGTAALLGVGVALHRDLALSMVLERLADDDLRQLVDDALGPLLAWDRRHGSDLVRTLAVHLRNGCRPSRTASALHLRRQSLYQRLERIETLLGRPVDEPAGYEHLVTVTCAHQLVAARAGQGRTGP